jgi:transposase-like protein
MIPTTAAEAAAQGWTQLMVGCPTCRKLKTVMINSLPRGFRFGEIRERLSCRVCGSRPDCASLGKTIPAQGYAPPRTESLKLF